MLSSGFYNSKGGDRKYDAEQFGAMFNGLITDGVFAHYKDALKVTAGSGNRELVVKPGRAWFNGTWTEVDDNGHSIYLMGSAVETTYFVYLAVNKLDRTNTIAWYSNITSNDPKKGLYFYLLAQVTVPGGVTKISDSMITDKRGSDLCPYVTGIMETVSFEEIVKRVCGDSWQDWLGVYEAGITTGVQNAVATSERALDEVKSMKAYAVESEAVSYIWAKFEAVPTGGGGFEWATDSVHTELSDPPMPMCLFRDLSYADLGPGFKPSISLNSPFIADGETTVKAIPAVTQSKVWKEYPYFWEGGAAFGTEVLRYDDLQRVVVNVGGTATEKYRYRTSRLMHIPVTYEPGAYIGTVSADNATAYPRDGYKDGYYYMRFAAGAEDVSFYYPGLSAKNVQDAIIEVVLTGGTGGGSAMSVIEVDELPATGISGVMYVVKKSGDSDAVEYLWLDRWEKIGGTGSGQNANQYRIKGKTVVFFGDSICAGAGDTGGYAKPIQETTGCIANNLGRSGATIANAGASTYKIVNMVKEFSGAADLIVVEGGTNDYNQGVALGEITATYADELDETTFCGALESAIQALLTNYPTAQLFGVFTHRDVSDTVTNSNGVTKKEFHDKAIAIYEKYALPYYDAYKDSGFITAYSTASGTPAFFKRISDMHTYNGDKVHPNEAGYAKYYVPQIIDMLERHCPIDEISAGGDTGGDTGDGVPVTINADMGIVGFIRAAGTISTAETGRRTDYISMEGVRSITVKVGGYSSTCAVAFFDSSKAFLADISVQNSQENGAQYGWIERTIDVTGSKYAGAKFFVISSYHNSAADHVYNGDNDFSYDSAYYTKMA